MIKRKTQEMELVWERVGELIKTALVKHFDETGMRVEGKLAWIHIACITLLCQFRLGESRDDVMQGATRKIIHDFWKSYSKINTAVHSFCLAHLNCELEAEVERGDKFWSKVLQELLRSANKGTQDAKEKGLWLSHLRINEIEQFYDCLVDQAIKTAHNPSSIGTKRTGWVQAKAAA